MEKQLREERKSTEKRIWDILCKEHYKALGLLDLKSRYISFPVLYGKDSRWNGDTQYPYEKVIDDMIERWVDPSCQKAFRQCTSLETVRENMTVAGKYCFQVYTKSDETECGTYYWYDKEKEIVLIALNDMREEQEHDPVTGALNREGYMHHAAKILASNPDEKFAILYFNISRFKTINDLFGYETGDLLLRKGINSLRSSFLRPLLVARMEADRFAILVEQKNLDYTRLTELLHTVYEKADMKVDIYGICGIYLIPEHCTLSVSEMYDRAKLAKNWIKNQYVQPYAVFQEQMKADYEQTSIAISQLEDAIKNGEIQIYYQPIYDAHTEKIVSAEALARWNSAEYGIMLPGKFVPALEESGHITLLDTCVHHKIYDFLRDRKAKGMPTVKIAMNLSRMDLMDDSIMQLILKDIRDTEEDVIQVGYEITESAYATISPTGMDFLKTLHSSGTPILMDDFGSGVSSFSTIREYEFDVLKLDMGFTRKIGTNAKNDNIIISVIDLAHRLDMKVIAEGVETREQADFLKENGCDFFQGYYFSRPVPQDQFEALLERDL